MDDRAFALGRGEKAVPAATRTKSKMLRNIVKMLWYDVSWDVIEEVDEQKSEEDESLVVIDSPRLLGLLPVLQQLNNKKRAYCYCLVYSVSIRRYASTQGTH